MPVPPEPAFLFWYQYYFATQVGKAGYAKYLDQFNKFIWHQASPKWNFDDATYDRSAASFNNPDHVEIVMHDYRWRLGLADGERKYDDLEKRLAALPSITVPAITMEGDSNGAAHPPESAYRAKFSGKYDFRTRTDITSEHHREPLHESANRVILESTSTIKPGRMLKERRGHPWSAFGRSMIASMCRFAKASISGSVIAERSALPLAMIR